MSARLSNYLSVTVCLALLALASVRDSQPAIAQADKGKTYSGHQSWKLHQKHIFNGREEVYIAPSVLKVDFVDLGYTLIADDKVGTVGLFNDSKKIGCIVPIDKFHSSISSTLSIANECPSGLSWQRWQGRPPRDMLKIPGRWYSANESKNVFKGSPHGGFLAGGRRVEHCTHMLFVADGIKLAPRLNKIYCEMQGEPNLQALPLIQYCDYLESRDQKSWLKTLALEPVKPDQQALKAPDYKAASQLDVTTPSKTNIFEELLP